MQANSGFAPLSTMHYPHQSGQSLQAPVPAPGQTHATAASNTPLVPVSVLPLDVRAMFPYSHLNRVQSECFPLAFGSDAPLVVSAPTGSGKTVVLELAMARFWSADAAASAHMAQSASTSWTCGGWAAKAATSGTIDAPNKGGAGCDGTGVGGITSAGGVGGAGAEGRSRAAVVYMAPLKALTAERYADWAPRLSRVGRECFELTGDIGDDAAAEERAVGRADVVLTTPEKWDAFTRFRRNAQGVIGRVGLLLIDEVHLLAEEKRGPTLEAVVARMKLLAQSVYLQAEPIAKLRVVGISATISNIHDIAHWLHPNCAVAAFDASYRPVPLTFIALPFRMYNTYNFDALLASKLHEVIRQYACSRPALVFCNSRNASYKAAAEVARASSGGLLRGEAAQALARACSQLDDRELSSMARCGVAYYHAGLSVGDKRTLERLFLDGLLPVLCSTSGLAVGVNLPAHLVVICNTCHYSNGGWEEYSRIDILQMAGRAGRPQFDTSGTCVVLTRQEMQNHYEGLLHGTETIESSLHLHMATHLNSEIASGRYLGSVEECIRWLKATFLYVRLKSNPPRYGMPRGLSDAEMDDKVRELCLKRLHDLGSSGMVELAHDGTTIKSRKLGWIAARYCIEMETTAAFNELDAVSDAPAILTMLSRASEFATACTLRRAEKVALAKINASDAVRFPIMEGKKRAKCKTTANKVYLLFQLRIGGHSLGEFHSTEVMLRNCGCRILRALVDFAEAAGLYSVLHHALALSKGLEKASGWADEDLGSVRQFEGIGPVVGTRLQQANCCRLADFAQLTTARAESLCQKHGSSVSSALASARSLLASSMQLNLRVLAETRTVELNLAVADAAPTQRLLDVRWCLMLGDTSTGKLLLVRKFSTRQARQEPQQHLHYSVKMPPKCGPNCFDAHLIALDHFGLDAHATTAVQAEASQRPANGEAARAGAPKQARQLGRMQNVHTTAAQKKTSKVGCKGPVASDTSRKMPALSASASSGPGASASIDILASLEADSDSDGGPPEGSGGHVEGGGSHVEGGGSHFEGGGSHFEGDCDGLGAIVCDDDVGFGLDASDAALFGEDGDNDESATPRTTERHVPTSRPKHAMEPTPLPGPSSRGKKAQKTSADQLRTSISSKKRKVSAKEHQHQLNGQPAVSDFFHKFRLPKDSQPKAVERTNAPSLQASAPNTLATDDSTDVDIARSGCNINYKGAADCQGLGASVTSGRSGDFGKAGSNEYMGGASQRPAHAHAASRSGAQGSGRSGRGESSDDAATCGFAFGVASQGVSVKDGTLTEEQRRKRSKELHSAAGAVREASVPKVRRGAGHDSMLLALQRKAASISAAPLRRLPVNHGTSYVSAMSAAGRTEEMRGEGSRFNSCGIGGGGGGWSGGGNCGGGGLGGGVGCGGGDGIAVRLLCDRSGSFTPQQSSVAEASHAHASYESVSRQPASNLDDYDSRFTLSPPPKAPGHSIPNDTDGFFSMLQDDTQFPDWLAESSCQVSAPDSAPIPCAQRDMPFDLQPQSRSPLSDQIIDLAHPSPSAAPPKATLAPLPLCSTYDEAPLQSHCDVLSDGDEEMTQRVGAQPTHSLDFSTFESADVPPPPITPLQAPSVKGVSEMYAGPRPLSLAQANTRATNLGNRHCNTTVRTAVPSSGDAVRISSDTPLNTCSRFQLAERQPSTGDNSLGSLVRYNAAPGAARASAVPRETALVPRETALSGAPHAMRRGLESQRQDARGSDVSSADRLPSASRLQSVGRLNLALGTNALSQGVEKFLGDGAAPSAADTQKLTAQRLTQRAGPSMAVCGCAAGPQPQQRAPASMTNLNTLLSRHLSATKPMFARSPQLLGAKSTHATPHLSAASKPAGGGLFLASSSEMRPAMFQQFQSVQPQSRYAHAEAGAVLNLKDHAL